MEPAQRPAADAGLDVEILELTAVAPRKHGYVPRVVFVVGVALLAGFIALAGVPSRTSFAFDSPLPNIFTATPAP